MKAAPRRLDSPEATQALGASLAACLVVGDVVCLWGPLGAGKTTLARGLIRALTSPDEEIPSPTFTLVQTYEGSRLALAHFDLYRLNRPEEVDELGLEDATDQGAAVIEWPERLGDRLPRDRLDIVLSIEGEGRGVRLQPHGAWEGRAIEF